MTKVDKSLINDRSQAAVPGGTPAASGKASVAASGGPQTPMAMGGGGGGGGSLQEEMARKLAGRMNKAGGAGGANSGQPKPQPNASK